MPLYFADTGYWLALPYKGDDLHAKANQLAQVIDAQLGAKIYTTDLVLTELLNSKTNLCKPSYPRIYC